MSELYERIIVESEMAWQEVKKKLDANAVTLAPYVDKAKQQIMEMQAGINDANETLGYDSGYRVVGATSNQQPTIAEPINIENNLDEATRQKLKRLATVRAVLTGKIPGKWVEVKYGSAFRIKNQEVIEKIFGITLGSLLDARVAKKGGLQINDERKEAGIDIMDRIWKYSPNGRKTAYFVAANNPHYDLITPDLIPNW